jgi:hypothetical protein
MQSSNSDSPRLSQAALSRSHFLRLAAGALFPFVGWRLPAAAAPNPELAQNSDASATNEAAALGRMGAILVSEFGSVKIHSYLSPADGFQVNTQMIEGPKATPAALRRRSRVIRSDAREACRSHHSLPAHTDHWAGLQVLTERFPNARVFALDGSPTRFAPVAQRGSMASAELTAISRRRRSPKDHSGSMGSPTTSSGSSTGPLGIPTIRDRVIRDNGTGIPPEVREKIFNPFTIIEFTHKLTHLSH